MSNSSELLSTGIGLGGSQVISDNERYNGKWKVITAITDIVIDEYVDSKMTGTVVGLTIKQGDSLGGSITSIKLISGSAILYQ